MFSRLFVIFLCLVVSSGCSFRLKRSPFENLSLGIFFRNILGWNLYSIGGSAENIIGNNLSIRVEVKSTPDANPESETLEISSSGNFRFSRSFPDNANYTVSVLNSPTDPSQVCEVTGASGTISGRDVGSVGVVCGNIIYVQTPTFSPPPSEYYVPTSIMINTVTNGAQIYYSLDGNNPDCSGLNGTLYTGPVSLVSPGGPPNVEYNDLRAIACKNYRSSFVQRGDYTITNGLLNPPVFDLTPGNYAITQTLGFIPPGTPASVVVHYTLDDTTPTCASATGNSITVSSSAIVRAVSCLAGYTRSSERRGYFEITGTVAPPSFSSLSGNYNNDILLSLSTPTSGSSIRYNLSVGSDPPNPDCLSSTLYTSPINIQNHDTRIIALACKAGWTDSNLVSHNFNLLVSDPQILPTPGSYSSSISVTGKSNTSGASVHYRLGAPATCADSTTAPLLSTIGVESLVEVYLVACKTNYNSSSQVLGSYTMTGKIPNPVFSLPGGTYGGNQSITVSPGVGSPAGVSIHLTTDGSLPNCESPSVPNPVNVSASVTIQAIVCKLSPLWDASSVVSSSYSINGQIISPTFSASPGLASGIYANEQTITMTTEPGAIIYYTLGDGSQAPPTCGIGTLGTSVIISENSNNRIKAIACRAGYADSVLAISPSYSLKAGVPVPTIAAGVYQTTQNIDFSTLTTGATTHMTFGTSLPPDPTCASPSTTVNIPIHSPSYRIKAIACKAGYANSDIFTSGVYTVTGTMSAPNLTGPLGVNNFVTLNAVTPPSTQTLCYAIGADPECSATNGGLPSVTGGFCATGSTAYSTAVPFVTSGELRARSCSNQYIQSPISQVTVTISGTVGSVNFTPDPSLVAYNDYTTNLTAAGSAIIYYRTDGINPDCTGIGANSGTSIPITQNGISIRAIACSPLTNPSPVVTKTSNLQVALPTRLTPVSDGTFVNSFQSTWNTTTTGANLLYRVDGVNPVCSNPGASGTSTYGGPINFPMTGTGGIHNFRMVGCKTNYAPSTPANSSFTLEAEVPNFQLTSQNFTPTSATLPPTTFHLRSNTTAVNFCSTTSGVNPACNPMGGCTTGINSSLYQHNLPGTTVVKTIACRTDFLASSVLEKSLTLSSPILRIFTTNTETDGNLSISSADSVCNTDLNRPYTLSQYKVFRMGGGRSQSSDWVMLKSWDYYRTDGTTIIGSTQAVGVGWTSNVLANSISSGAAANVFTGMNMDGAGNLTESTINCSGWTVNDSTMGRAGLSVDSGAGSVAYGSNPCSTVSKLYCMEQPLGAKRIFLTSDTVTSIVGLAGADSACSSDTNKPSTGTYKALIGTSARNPSSDWPLQPNTLYLRTDNVTPIAYTNAQRQFIFPLTNSIAVLGATNNVFTGIDATTNPWTVGDNCSNFSSSVLGNSVTGTSNAIDVTSITDGSLSCGVIVPTSARIYCVEQ
ncbi:chitobiase/beta-hexosaminidase C-terminal domain-containing protein [Leptospira sp. 96542]|nr:chitobiase/beta-hexosaminidase C-terminal domain-containing protein [Leptospira sp. 96542]